MTEITENYLKAKSSTYDLETIFNLILNKCNIIQLRPILNSCVNLIELDLSYNNISNISILDGKKLQQLTILKLNHNSITEFNSSTSYFPSLTDLHLIGNNIDNIKSITNFPNYFPSIKQLYFQTYNNNYSNPICKLNNYRSTILNCYPKLLILDEHELNNEFELNNNKTHNQITTNIDKINELLKENQLNQQEKREKLSKDLDLLLNEPYMDTNILNSINNNVKQVQSKVKLIENTASEINKIELDLDSLDKQLQEKLNEATMEYEKMHKENIEAGVVVKYDSSSNNYDINNSQVNGDSNKENSSKSIDSSKNKTSTNRVSSATSKTKTRK